MKRHGKTLKCSYDHKNLGYFCMSVKKESTHFSFICVTNCSLDPLINTHTHSHSNINLRRIFEKTTYQDVLESFSQFEFTCILFCHVQTLLERLQKDSQQKAGFVWWINEVGCTDHYHFNIFLYVYEDSTKLYENRWPGHFCSKP